MESYVCTVAGGKGGVGRTTTALNVGSALETREYETVVVDVDLGMSNVATMVGIDPEGTIHDVLAGTATVDETLVELESGLTALPGEWEIDAYGEADAAKLRTVVETLRNDYDVILLDTSAGISHETTVAIGLADGTVLVTTGSDVSMADTLKTEQLVERVGGNVLGTVLTRVTDETQFTAARERLDLPVLGAVPEDTALASDPVVVTSDSSPACEAYSQLTDSLVRVIFEGAEPETLDPVFEPAWVDADDTVQEAVEAEETEGEPDEDDDDDVLGLFN